MEDLFFNATSDLDKLLDEFEQREAPNEKQKEKKPLSSKENLALSTGFSSKNGGDASSKFSEAKKSIPGSSKHISTPNITTSANSNSNDTSSDMLIDFSAPIIPASSATETTAVQKNTLQDLDFLLSILPQQDFVRKADNVPDDKSVTSMLNDNLHKTQSNAISKDNTFKAPVEDFSKHLDDNFVKEKAVVGFNSDVQIDNSEFNEFMGDSSNLTGNPQNKETITSDSSITLLPDDNNGVFHNSPDFSNVTTSYPASKTPSEVGINEKVKNKSISKLQELPRKNLTPIPSSSVHVPSHSDSDVSIQGSHLSHPNTSSSLQSRLHAVSDSKLSKQHVPESSILSGTVVKPELQNEVKTKKIKKISALPTVSENNKNQQLPSTSPPSYSSVVAEEYRPPSIVQAWQPIVTPTTSRTQEVNQIENVDSSGKAADEPIERAMEATEETGNNLIDSSASTPAGPSNSPASHVLRPGLRKPYWVPDEESAVCTKCQSKFTFTKRRHHCRACGRIFCSNCCSERMKLAYLNFAEARVCLICIGLMEQASALSKQSTQGVPSPANATSAPVSVLRTEHPGGSTMPKSVRFSDGTKPHHPSVLPATPPPPPARTHRGARGNRMPEASPTSKFPPLILEFKDDGSFAIDENPDSDFVLTLLRTNENDVTTFALSANLFVMVKQVQYCFTPCYYFLSSGLDHVGQSEIAVLLEVKADDQTFPIKVFTLYSHLFSMARKGKTVQANDFLQVEEISNQTGYLIGCTDYAGFLFVRRTVQDVEGLSIDFPDERSILFSPTVQFSSTLFVLMVHKSEVAWTKLFYSRFLLGLGAKYKQYPYPIVNYLNRDPIYTEVANTILGILCDFRNYKYKVISISGLSVLIGQNGVSVNIPCNRFADVMKIINSSNEHVIALGSDTFLTADDTQSHLVAVQNPSTRVYYSSVLSNVEMTNDENHQVGAAFIVLNGSLKSGSLQQAKCTIVEDGVMIQLLPEKMSSLKESLKAMEDFRVSCNSSDSAKSLLDESSNAPTNSNPANSEIANQFLEIRWVGDDTNFNIGISSPVDFCSFEGIVGYNVQGKSEKKEKNQVLRWNQVFFFKSTNDIIDMSRLAERVANGCFQALLPHLQLLRKSSQTKIGVRVNIHPDDVGYAVGSHGLPLPDQCLNALDDELIQLTHEASSSLQAEDDPVVFELIFSILDIRPSWKTALTK